MRQISARKRSYNVVKIGKTDYCGFGRVSSFILSHPSIYLHSEKPADHLDQQESSFFLFILFKKRINTDLTINPTFLLRISNLITREHISQQKRRCWIMLSHIRFHQCRIGIGIAIFTQMTAGVISTNVSSQQAGALVVPLICFTLRNI